MQARNPSEPGITITDCLLRILCLGNIGSTDHCSSIAPCLFRAARGKLPKTPFSSSTSTAIETPTRRSKHLLLKLKQDYDSTISSKTFEKLM